MQRWRRMEGRSETAELRWAERGGGNKGNGREGG
jgi:hypothetical protein